MLAALAHAWVKEHRERAHLLGGGTASAVVADTPDAIEDDRERAEPARPARAG